MATLTILPQPTAQKIRIEVDKEQWERISASLGFFNKEFLESLERADREVAQGKAKRLRSLRDLRRRA